MAFGHLIKEARKARGWSMADLAERMGVGRGYIGQLETDRIERPRVEVLMKLEQVLGVTREEIARAGGYIGGDEPVDPYDQFRELCALPNDEVRYLELLKLPPDVVDAIQVLALTLFRRSVAQARRS